MEKQLFRKKSMETISSPEQLNDYIKVSSPGIWTVLTAVIVLLAGVCVWGIWGHLETVIPAVAVSQNGVTTCYAADDAGSIQAGMTVRVNGEEYTITSVSQLSPEEQGQLEAYFQQTGQTPQGNVGYILELNQAIGDGVYTAEIVAESIAPVSFLWN